MFRAELRKGKFVVRYDGMETKVDVVGNLTKLELQQLIDTLREALDRREKFDIHMESLRVK